MRRGSNPGFGSNIVICLWSEDDDDGDEDDEGVDKDTAFPVKVEVWEKLVLVDAREYPWHCWIEMEMEANASETQAVVLNIMLEWNELDWIGRGERMEAT